MARSVKLNIPLRSKGDRGKTSPIRGVCADGKYGVRRFFSQANPASPELHVRTLRLQEAEIKGELIIHVIHVAGTRIMSWE